MIDEDIHPLDQGDTPDDAELKARVIRAYQRTPSSSPQMVAECARAVLVRATGEFRRPGGMGGRSLRRPGRFRRYWVGGTVAMAAALLLAVAIRSRSPVSAVLEVASVAGSGAPSSVPGQTQFELRLPNMEAAQVFVVGDFNGWDASATPMTKGQSDGEWSAQVVLLPGRHVYAYVVNGEQWVVDPLAPQIPDAGYGPANAVVVEGGTK